MITVYLPTFDRAAKLREALRSLRLQTLAKEQFRVVIADNASSDETPQVIGEFPDLTLVHGRRERNVGLIANQASTNKTADRYAEEGAMTAITAASTDHEQVIDLTGKVRGARDLNERRRLSPPDQAHDVCSDHSH